MMVNSGIIACERLGPVAESEGVSDHMIHRRLELDYAQIGPFRRSLAQQRVIVGACALGASWLAWLVIGLESFDPFDDSLNGWLCLTVGGCGTLCGLTLFLVALSGMWGRSAIRRRCHPKVIESAPDTLNRDGIL
jgi:hypothetical protein